jgi:hypothetical protein
MEPEDVDSTKILKSVTKTYLTRWRHLELTLLARNAFVFEPFSMLEGKQVRKWYLVGGK